MSLLRLYYKPTSAFTNFFDDALTAHLCPRACAPSTVASHCDIYCPRLYLRESEDNNTITVTVELPGLTSEDVAIDVNQNRLTVSGALTRSDAQEEKTYIVRERHSGKFTRTLQLPSGTKAEDVKARMENGILTITFPKSSPEQQVKRIVIQ